MGLQFSCSLTDFCDLEEKVEPLIVRSISFEDENVMTTVRSVSFNGRDSETKILKSLGSGKMIVKGSVSFRNRDSDPLKLEKTASFKTSPLSIPTGECGLKLASFKGRENMKQWPPSNVFQGPSPYSPTTETRSPKHEAAVKLQKVYKSFRTRRQLADCVVLAEQEWWKLLDFAELKRSSVSFFDIGKPETAVSRWSRARTRAAKVGKGLSKDEKALKLALQHWLEAIDPRHRYGHNLDFYYDKWLKCKSRQPFFYWLDVGEGKEVNLEQCPRSKLQRQCIKYLGPKERGAYEVIVDDGKFFYKRNGKLLDTSEGDTGTKWIFVLSTSKTLYVGKKQKGAFQHSSFLAGGATSAAGRLVVDKGILKAVWPHSGHYKPTKENFQEFMTFLKEKNVDLCDVKEHSMDDDEDSVTKHGSHVTHCSSSAEVDLGHAMDNLATDNAECGQKLKQTCASDAFCIGLPGSMEPLTGSMDEMLEESTPSKQEDVLCEQSLIENEEYEVSQESILRRINSHKETKSYQLGKQLSCKWTTGAGPRISCVRDYPMELQFRALEQVNLSPRTTKIARASSTPVNISSPRPKAWLHHL